MVTQLCVVRGREDGHPKGHSSRGPLLSLMTVLVKMGGLTTPTQSEMGKRAVSREG